MSYTPPTQEEIDSVDLSWKRYLLPKIHPEGEKILLAELIIFALLGLLVRIFIWFYLGMFIWLLGAALLVFSFYFFRNPTRVPPDGTDLILAPADGIVSNIKPLVPPAELGLGNEERLRISIFMSVFSVHVNRSPVTGTVKNLYYVRGKFVSVQDKDSEDNERQLIGIQAVNGQMIGCIQIAGLVARRIYCPLKIGDSLNAGDEFGMIRFGSRLDVYLPKGVEPLVKVGQIAVAGETILGNMAGLSQPATTEQPTLVLPKLNLN